MNSTGELKVLHVVGDSRFGGAARIILGLGRVAQSEGWRVDVLTTDPVFQQAAREQGLGVVDLDVIRRDIRPVWDLVGLLRLRRFLCAESYDIVQTHTSKAGFVGRLAARLAGVPIVLHTAHGFAFHEGSSPSTRFFYSALERCASNWCDAIVSVSEFHRAWAIRLGMCSPDRIVAIPNGIAEPVHNPNIRRPQLRKELGIRCGDPLAMTIGRLAADKGLEYLIEAAALLPPACRIQIVIAGEGPARHSLTQLAIRLKVMDRVRFIGFREDVGDLLSACDLVVLPSLREGLSISLLEAMAAAKPIVATSIGSQREVAGHSEIAWLVRPGNAKALRDAMLRLIEDPITMAHLAVNARMAYRNRYTEGRMLRSYRRLYLELLNRKGLICEDQPGANDRELEDFGAGCGRIAPQLRFPGIRS